MWFSDKKTNIWIDSLFGDNISSKTKITFFMKKFNDFNLYKILIHQNQATILSDCGINNHAYLIIEI